LNFQFRTTSLLAVTTFIAICLFLLVRANVPLVQTVETIAMGFFLIALFACFALEKSQKDFAKGYVVGCAMLILIAGSALADKDDSFVSKVLDNFHHLLSRDDTPHVSATPELNTKQIPDRMAFRRMGLLLILIVFSVACGFANQIRCKSGVKPTNS